MNNLNDTLIQQIKSTAEEILLNQLSNCTFVDMGIIVNAVYTEKGYRCRVNTFRLIQDQFVHYENVELLMIGNLAGGVDLEVEGCPCIVFGPMSSSTSIIEGNIMGTHKPYDITFMKCIPVGNPCYWRGKLSFNEAGDLSYAAPSGKFEISTVGSIGYEQYNTNVKLCIDPIGAIIISTDKYMYHKEPDGSYYTYVKGVEPGSISFFESYLDNIKDTFKTTIDDFEEDLESDDDEWVQLLLHDSWKYHKEERDGIITITLYDDDGNLISEEIMNPDGSRMLTRTDSDGNTIFMYTINEDGSIEIDIGDGKYNIGIGKDGHVIESTEGKRSIDANDAIDITSSSTIDITGGDTVTVSSDADININATATGLVTIGNSIKTLGALLDQLCDALSALHTEGSPAAHTGAAWAASQITPIKILIGQVLG